MSDAGQQRQHSEPWRLMKDDPQEMEYVIFNGSNKIIHTEAKGHSESRKKEQVDFLKHSLACVNGCTGIEPSSVPMMLQGLKSVASWLAGDAPIPYTGGLEDWLRDIISQAEPAEQVGTTLASKPPQNK